MTNLNNQANKNITTKVLYVIVFILAILTLFIIYVLSDTKTEITKEENNENFSISSLTCFTEKPAESFLNLEDASNTKQKYVITFYDNRINNIMYTSDIDYQNEELSRIKEAELYTEYEKYMHEHGLDIEQLSYSFIKANSTVKAKLYIEKKNLTPITAKLFLLDSDNYTPETIQPIYEHKGFICNYKD